MLKLLVSTNEPLHCLALELLFSPCADISLLPIVCDLQTLVSEVATGNPDILLLTVDTGLNWELLSTLRRQSPNTRVVLWVHDISAELAHQGMERGVRGILRKNLPPDMILKCVRKVHQGEFWFEETLTQSFLSGRTVKISQRESQLIDLVSQGLKNKEIATVMSITEGTVKVYVSRLFEKVGAKDRLELALVGLRNAQLQADTPGMAQAYNLRTMFITSRAPQSNGSKELPLPSFFARSRQVAN